MEQALDQYTTYPQHRTRHHTLVWLPNTNSLAGAVREFWASRVAYFQTQLEFCMPRQGTLAWLVALRRKR